jgi:hypothetical protein
MGTRRSWLFACTGAWFVVASAFAQDAPAKPRASEVAPPAPAAPVPAPPAPPPSTAETPAPKPRDVSVPPPAAGVPEPSATPAAGASPTKTPGVSPAAGAGPSGSAGVNAAPPTAAGTATPAAAGTPSPPTAAGTAPPTAAGTTPPTAARPTTVAPAGTSTDRERPPIAPSPAGRFYARLSLGIEASLWLGEASLWLGKSTQLFKPATLRLDLGYALRPETALIVRAGTWLRDGTTALNFLGAGVSEYFDDMFVTAVIGLDVYRVGSLSHSDLGAEGLAGQFEVGQIWRLSSLFEFAVGVHFELGTPLGHVDDVTLTTIGAGIFVSVALH